MMAVSEELHELIARVRGGDQDAAAEVVRKYQPYVRRAIRIQLRDPRLRSALDASDICQSVMASFFARLTLGQYEFDQPSQLAALLSRMARTKVATQARRAEVTRRERGGQRAIALAVRGVAGSCPDPSQLVAGRDLVEQFLLRLTTEERALCDRRGDRKSWSDIAAELGGTADSQRKRLARALDRVAAALGLGDDADL
jgi:DNA-directed RNA polymerase specialized sigma24 family protein